MEPRTKRRIYQACYTGLCNPAFNIPRRMREGAALKKEFPEFAHTIHMALKHAIEDYVTDADELRLTACRTIGEVIRAFP